MNDKLRQFQARARELARSSNFNGWRQVAFELQFEEGFAEAFQWVYDDATQAELDGICRESRGHLQAELQTGWHPLALRILQKFLGTLPKGTKLSPQ